MGEQLAKDAMRADSLPQSALSLRPVPPRRELLQRITAVLSPLTPDADAFTDEPMRDVDELHQVLVAESR